MRNNTGHIGYGYQIRCALLHILREFGQRTGVITFRMEHENGDDFDFVYNDKLNVFQTKDEADPDMPTHLAKMWRRSTENIEPFTTSQVHLTFIFSKDHTPTNQSYAALAKKHVSSQKLTPIRSRINADLKTKKRIRSAKEWRTFLEPIDITVLTYDQLESETLERLRLLTFGNESTDSQIAPIVEQYYGRLLVIMTTTREVPFNDLREILLDRLAQQALENPRLQAKFRSLYEKPEQNPSSYKLAESSITGSETLP